MLPAFRSLVARELIEKYDFSQVDAAEKIGTTQAAISYYLYSKRGEKRIKELGLLQAIQSTACSVAKDIATGESSSSDAMVSLCTLCKNLRKQDIICRLHKNVTSVPEVCVICPEFSQR